MDTVVPYSQGENPPAISKPLTYPWPTLGGQITRFFLLDKNEACTQNAGPDEPNKPHALRTFVRDGSKVQSPHDRPLSYNLHFFNKYCSCI